MTRLFAVLIGGFTLLCTGLWPSTPASAQVLERGVEGAAVGAIIGGIVNGGRGAGTGAAIGAGVGALSGAAEANARAHGYYGPPPGYGPPPTAYYGPPHSYGSRRGHYGAPNPVYSAPPPRGAVVTSISIAPPPLPVYDQPLCPGPGYAWTPGYWAYAAGGYYWVPGTWVLPPAIGLVWTPGYWGYDSRRYTWHAGYWGPQVGYYGGINYGFGYFGTGFEGGYWKDGAFLYNTAVTRVNTAVITNTYNKQAVGTVTVNNLSFNGPGGITAKPTSQEVVWSRKRHTQPTATQAKHQRAASANRALYSAANHGMPTIAATAKPGVFNGPEIVGPKTVVATTKAAVGTGVTAPDDKARPHRQDGAAPGAGGEARPAAGQDAPGERHSPSAAAANGGVASDTGKKAFKPANMVKAPGSPTATVEPAPKARAVLPPATSSISGDKPAEGPLPVANTPSTPSAATSSGSSSSSSKSPTPASASAAGSGGPVQTANLEPTINIPPGTTRFGIEIGTVEKQAGLRPLWRDILTKHPALVAGLQARRMLAPDKKWQLIAGPFGSAAEAIQVCDLFKKENFKCEATAFAGDVL